MSDSRKSAEEILRQSLEKKTDEERREYLERACGDSTELRNEAVVVLRTRSLTESGEAPAINPGSQLPGSPSTEVQDLATTLPHPTDDRDPVGQSLPRRFHDYELLEEIAHGGMGVVYKARQISLNRIVALKMIATGELASEDEIKRFQIEAESAAHLDHPGIVPVFDVGCCQGQHFFSMAFVEGQSLSVRIEQGRVAPRLAAIYARKIALAAQVAHEQGIVHRDLKPGNVLLDQHGEPKVTDFGLAKRVQVASELTATGIVIGTPCYMPPEQASGKLDQIGVPADVYSLGAILYALLTTQPPFKGQTQIETLLQVVQEEPVRPRQRAPSVPSDLEVICLKCLEKKPGDRYATAAALANDLQRFLSGEPILAKNDFRRRFRKWTLREPVLAAHLAATLAMMLVIFFNYWIVGGGSEKNFDLLWLNQTILFLWAVAVFLLQKAQNVFKTRIAIPVIWAGANPLFLTFALGVNPAPRGALFSLYLLLMVMNCFFRRLELVVVTTLSSVIGYLLLLWICFEEESVVTPMSYLIVFGITLIVGGFLMGLLALRLKRLSQQNNLAEPH